MKCIRACFLAFSMYSRIPTPHTRWDPKDMEYVFCFFPLIGAAAGALQLLWWKLTVWLGFDPVLIGAGCVLLPLLLTGGIHLDGFCDTADALASHQSREQKLEILKDSHVGAFALIACVCYILLQFGLWVQAVSDRGPILVLAVVPVLSRTLSGLAAVTRKNARGSGMLATFTDAIAGKHVLWTLIVWLIACVAGLIWIDPLLGGVTAAAAGVAYGYYTYVSTRQFGGITGDLAGWFLQICELVCLFAVVAAERVVTVL